MSAVDNPFWRVVWRLVDDSHPQENSKAIPHEHCKDLPDAQEIDDEHDEVENDIQKLDDDTYIINGIVTLRDINRHLGWNLPDDHASTIAGLLIHEAQEIPSVGESYEIHGFDCTVIEKSAMQITRVKMKKRPETRLHSDIEL